MEEAKAVFDKQEEIVVNGHTLYIDYSLKVQQGKVDQVEKLANKSSEAFVTQLTQIVYITSLF